MRGYVVEAVLSAAGAAGALTVGLRTDTTFWTVVGALLAAVALACLVTSVRMKLTGTTDPRVPRPRRLRRPRGSGLDAVPPAPTVRRFPRRTRRNPGDRIKPPSGAA
ncbi:hypothetical protein UO65_2193 [Actinokineospora spheciospongiae]|uniref:Uncharacterized protein n=2 Tax=Actinokineospora spheciospongiae TaxID=909613 RepID=W7J0P6_9PSEU|nr:hypothetical protein [Actinokineospora spheciospongiae]EWC62506.1 hypothetical protein UO65_2193 [Actinokineospora spheciospongiae]PWW63022.1 hypothetical protein DFQ13_10412 [Actinokineospora spheciospongiae]